ncbi:MAG: hypothetical protein COX81_01860 [Candidatus Magasanikbacteria bacterium CG_4_10_14_0_2_um_filter_37_12]|uniref:Uncharacterized protein n=1 Tax=Candidatus Magasanikbacteria bacterium CG_4_10_14_0_2_um_filter_37_12 TaxID=1974637 RepID=A0A2M7V8B5_9BACT|nr:MAG: hypothetical protein COX81_01860 [Candidatus Magasanikbacteria bacterium CG_4_10_14_0_2_um_filter_37_12]
MSPDTFTETTKIGFGSSIGGSFKGIFFGLLLFLASFVVIYMNEGRVDKSEIAKNAVQVNASVLESHDDLQGALVAAIGIFKTDDLIGDGEYLVSGNYLAVSRNVETYTWVEKVTSKTEDKLGGSQEVTKTYNYVKEWTSSPADSGSFKIPAEHENKITSIKSISTKAPNGMLGVYKVDMKALSLPGSAALPLNTKNVQLPTYGEIVNGKYIYIGDSSMNDPVVGDVRISYSVTESDRETTVFAKLNGDKLGPYLDKKTDKTLYEARRTGLEESVTAMHGEYRVWLWALRVIGFLMMWMGLASILGPISVLLSVIPALGSIGGSITRGVTFIIALVLSIVVILISMLFHNLLVLILLGVAGVGAAVWFVKGKMGKSK